jgi:hypothetical protein
MVMAVLKYVAYLCENPEALAKFNGKNGMAIGRSIVLALFARHRRTFDGFEVLKTKKLLEV